MKRLLIVVVALCAALLLQLTIVNGLALPGGGAPDLVLLCVVAVGLTGGPQAGLIAGFCAGLALDLAPPADQLIGQYALVFCLVGYACGRLRFTLTRSATLAMAAAAGAALAGEVLAAGLVLVLDTPEVTFATVAHELPSVILYDLVLSPVFIFAGVRIAVALGVNFNPLDDSPALEIGGSAQPTGLADLVRARRLRRATGTDNGVAGGAWLTGDGAADMAAMGAVGWLTGPATSRRARREQARLTAALTGAAPRKGSFWVGSRPPGLGSTQGSAPAQQSGLRKLRPESGVAGTAARGGLPAQLPTADGSELRGAAFDGTGSGGLSGSGWLSGGTNVPKISFGTGGLPGAGRAAGRGVPRIAFKATGPTGLAGSAAGADGSGRGGTGGGRVGGGTRTPKIAFGTGGLPGAGRAGGRGTPKIAFGSGGPRDPRISPGRPALPGFRSRSAWSGSGAWLAGSRLRSAGLRSAGPRSTGAGDQVRVPGSNYRAGGNYRPKVPRGRSWRRRRGPRWLSWPWRPTQRGAKR
jgi:rod shape-determining protein MreD